MCWNWNVVFNIIYIVVAAAMVMVMVMMVNNINCSIDVGWLESAFPLTALNRAEKKVWAN